MLVKDICQFRLPVPPFYSAKEQGFGYGPRRRGPSIQITLWWCTFHYNMLTLGNGHTFKHIIAIHKNRGWRLGFWWEPWVRFIRAPNDKVTAIWSTSTANAAARLQGLERNWNDTAQKLTEEIEEIRQRAFVERTER